MNEPALRSFLQDHPPARIAGLVRDDMAVLTDLEAQEIAHALACPCGSIGFRLLGVPAAMLSDPLGTRPGRDVDRPQRGYMLRSLLRIWRELRLASTGNDGGALTAPIVLDCVQCKARHVLVDQPSERNGAGPAPLEALRCRPCRRSSFDVTLVHGYENLDFEAEPRPGDEERFVALRVLVRCRTCGRRAEPVAQRSRDAQQITLDSLYGRNDPGFAAVGSKSESTSRPLKERSS